MPNLLFRFIVICATFHAGRIFERERAWWTVVVVLLVGVAEIIYNEMDQEYGRQAWYWYGYKNGKRKRQ